MAKKKENKKEQKEELTRRQRLRLKAKRATVRIREELKKSFKTAIVAAFGFLIALAWKDLITEAVKTIVAASPLNAKIVEATIITLISVTGILLITTLLKEKNAQ